MGHIRITATGEPDISPITRRYEFSAGDEDVLAASINQVRGVLHRGLRININDALLLYGGYAGFMTRDGIDGAKIADGAASLLTEDRVMIGVPEMLDRLDIEVVYDSSTAKISIGRPIGRRTPRGLAPRQPERPHMQGISAGRPAK